MLFYAMKDQVITLAEANAYFQRADKQAIRFLKYHETRQQAKATLIKHEKKYASAINKPVAEKLPALLAIPGHLAAATVEASILAPFFGGLMSGWGFSDETLQIISYFPILVFCGYTLMVGNFWHQAKLVKSTVVPNTLHGDWLELVMGLILGGAYVWALYWTTLAAADMLSSKPHTTSIILSMGIAELLLGYFTIPGWQVAYAYGKKYWFQYSLQQSHKRMFLKAAACAQSYHYYEMMIRYLNIENEGLYEFKSNGRIKAVLAYNQAPIILDNDDSDFGMLPVQI